jgi:poly(hydroxyalkanoate) granule-associated protein
VGNLIRFTGQDNPIISHRYSILVRQYLQTPEANSFYRSLRDFSSSDNIFSQVQPGLLEGNISPVGDGDSFVLGYFEVSSVSESRLFFNYVDFFPGEPLPPYFDESNCDRFLAPLLGDPELDGFVPPFVTCGQTLLELLAQDEIEDFVHKLVERGEVAEKDARKLVKDVMEKSRKQVGMTDDDVSHRVEDALDRMNVPTKSDIEALGEKIAQLTKKVDELKKSKA